MQDLRPYPGTEGVSSPGATQDDPDGRLPLLMHEIELLLAEKRTALSVMRTGIAVFALPLSVLSVLIATSRYYTMSEVALLLIPVMAINVGLVALGVYLVTRAMRRIHAVDRMIVDLKAKSGTLSKLVA